MQSSNRTQIHQLNNKYGRRSTAVVVMAGVMLVLAMRLDRSRRRHHGGIRDLGDEPKISMTESETLVDQIGKRQVEVPLIAPVRSYSNTQNKRLPISLISV